MNHLRDLERIIRNASTPGHFRRDAEGNEHAVSAYIIKFSYQTKVRGSEDLIVKTETAVVLATNSMEAKAAATRPYSGKQAKILSVTETHPSNPTLLRVSSEE